jgi:hypothetical protein
VSITVTVEDLSVGARTRAAQHLPRASKKQRPGRRGDAATESTPPTRPFGLRFGHAVHRSCAFRASGQRNCRFPALGQATLDKRAGL